MSTLVCFGLGYSAEHYIGMFGDGFARIIGTVRGAERATVLNAQFAGRLKALAVRRQIGHAGSAKMRSARPMRRWSRFRRTNMAIRCSHLRQSLAHAPHLRAIVYLSTVGVYGDRGGAWVDETTPPRRIGARQRAR